MQGALVGELWSKASPSHFYLKNKSKKGWGHGLSGTAPDK
jgi:hypothetical protein